MSETKPDWYNRPNCVGWWWSADLNEWRETSRNGLAQLLIPWPSAVTGFIYALDAQGLWWGPWEPPKRTRKRMRELLDEQ